jgi:hypothetical protein
MKNTWGNKAKEDTSPYAEMDFDEGDRIFFRIMGSDDLYFGTVQKRYDHYMTVVTDRGDVKKMFYTILSYLVKIHGDVSDNLVTVPDDMSRYEYLLDLMDQNLDCLLPGLGLSSDIVNRLKSEINRSFMYDKRIKELMEQK